MTKRTENTHSGIADREWPVYESYAFGVQRVQRRNILRSDQEREDAARLNSFDECVEVRAIIKRGGKATGYSLSDPDTHEDLLRDYLKIHAAEDALNYVKHRGFLGKAATDFDSLSSSGCLVAEILDSAAYLRWLISLSGAISEKNIRRLDSYKQEIRGKSDSALGVYVRDQIEGIYPFETSETIAGYVPARLHQAEEMLVYSVGEWEKFGTKKSLHAAKDYLKRASNRLLTGVQPILDWKLTTEGNWIPDECISVCTPWQAICYALLRNITGKGSLVLCHHCGDRFRQKRRDNLFCSSTCNRAYTRKYGSTIHSYPKEASE